MVGGRGRHGRHNPGDSGRQRSSADRFTAAAARARALSPGESGGRWPAGRGVRAAGRSGEGALRYSFA